MQRILILLEGAGKNTDIQSIVDHAVSLANEAAKPTPIISFGMMANDTLFTRPDGEHSSLGAFEDISRIIAPNNQVAIGTLHVSADDPENFPDRCRRLLDRLPAVRQIQLNLGFWPDVEQITALCGRRLNKGFTLALDGRCLQTFVTPHGVNEKAFGAMARLYAKAGINGLNLNPKGLAGESFEKVLRPFIRTIFGETDLEAVVTGGLEPETIGEKTGGLLEDFPLLGVGSYAGICTVDKHLEPELAKAFLTNYYAHRHPVYAG